MAKKRRRRRHTLRKILGAVGLLLLLAWGMEQLIPPEEAVARPLPSAASDSAPRTAATTAATTASATSPTTAAPTFVRTRDAVHITVPYVSQEGYPTGCESAAAVMLLRFYGVSMTMERFVDTCLDCGEITWSEAGLTAPHPAEQFVGNPRSRAAYGCYAPVLVRALQTAGLAVKEVGGTTLADLCRTYIDHGQPVIVWATMGMRPMYGGDTWTVASTGRTFTWPAREHCLVLTGYDANFYYFCDPEAADGEVAYERAVCETRYRELGRQAIAAL